MFNYYIYAINYSSNYVSLLLFLWVYNVMNLSTVLCVISAFIAGIIFSNYVYFKNGGTGIRSNQDAIDMASESFNRSINDAMIDKVKVINGAFKIPGFSARYDGKPIIGIDLDFESCGSSASEIRIYSGLIISEDKDKGVVRRKMFRYSSDFNGVPTSEIKIIFRDSNTK